MPSFIHSYGRIYAGVYGRFDRMFTPVGHELEWMVRHCDRDLDCSE